MSYMGVKSTFRIVFKLLIFFLFSINNLFAATTYGWTGTINSDWNNSGNWSPAGIPGLLDVAQLYVGAVNIPTLMYDVTITGLTVGSGFGDCGYSGVQVIPLNMNNFKLTVGQVTSPTSATGILHIESCPTSTAVGVGLVLSCSGSCANSSFVLNGILNGAHVSDEFSSTVDVSLNYYEYTNPFCRFRSFSKNLTISGLNTTNSCYVSTGIAFSSYFSTIAPYDGNINQMNFFANLNVCTVLGNLTLLNRTNKILTLGWESFTVYGNLYLSNTGGGQIRTFERTRQMLLRLMPGGLIAIPPDETLPQNGEIRLYAVNQMGTLTSLNIDLTTCPGGCIVAPTSNVMLNLTSCTFSGPVFIKTPSINFRTLRSPTQPFVFEQGFVNNRFKNDFNLTKTGPQNDYLVGTNVYFRDVNITNSGTGSLNFGTNSSAASVCSIGICASGCPTEVIGAVATYDGSQNGDTIRGNFQAIQSCGAGAINLMISTKTNVYFGDVDLKISSNMSVGGTMSFNGTIDQSLTVDDICSNNSILTMDVFRMNQAFNLNKLNCIYNSTLAGHQKLFIVNTGTTLNTGKVNTDQTVFQLNGAYNAHTGSNISYYIVNTVGGVRRVIPTSSVTGYLFPTGTSLFYFPLSITGASASEAVTVGMIQGVNSSYSGSPAFIPSGTTIGNVFINGVWLVNTTATGLKAMLKGGWWDALATLTDFDPTISARMITNDGSGWLCFGGTLNGVAFGTNPSWAFDYSIVTLSSIPGVYSVITDGVSGGPDQSICGQFNTSASLSATAVNSGIWSVITSPSPITFVSSVSGVTSIMGLNSAGTYSLLWSSTGYCGKSTSSQVNIYRAGSGTITGLWQGASQDWFECRNWDDGVIPSITTNVTIPGGKLFYPNSSVSGFSNNLSIIAITDLIIQNGGSFTLTTVSGNNLDLYGNLDVQTGSTLSVSSNNFVSFKGSNTMSTIIGGGNLLISNLRINKTSGDVLLNRGLTMQTGYGMLDLIKGILKSYETTSTGSNILIMNPGSFVNNVSDASYVDGWVRKVGNTPFVFPTGGSNGYKAIEITAPNTISDHFTAKYYSIDPTSLWDGTSKAPALHHVSKVEYWILDRTGGTSNAAVTLYWNLYSDVSYNAADYNQLLVSRWDGTTWTDLGNLGLSSSPSRNYGWIRGNDVVSFSPFTLATTIPANPLPLGLLTFGVKSVNEGAKIDWTLAKTNDLVSFEVEKSSDLITFKKSFSSKKEEGKSNYTITDEDPLKGTTYYRLKTLDVNGKTGYSKVGVYRSIFTAHETMTFNVSPNPFNSKVKVSLSAQSDQINLVIFDLTGMQLFNRNYTDQNEITLELENLPSGIYNIKITTPLTSYTEKLIKL
jgi:hypothetical protein